MSSALTPALKPQPPPNSLRLSPPSPISISISFSFSNHSLKFHNPKKIQTFYFNFPLRCSSSQSPKDSPKDSQDPQERQKKNPNPAPRRLSPQSSWESKDSQGHDYLLRLGTEADNMNISVGARHGIIDDLFVGTFLGRDSDIVFDYRQKATRSFQYLQGDYYIAPLFLVCNFLPFFIFYFCSLIAYLPQTDFCSIKLLFVIFRIKSVRKKRSSICSA
jgi:hypothetical protein